MSLRRVGLVLASLAVVSAGITLVYLGMRAVMDIGGACASGGPYVPVQPCPAGVPGLLVGGIFLGIIAALVYAVATIGIGVPSFTGLFWPALFMSLGWNFLEYGVAPPVGDGIVWGWLIPGILFEIMGIVPLWVMIRTVGVVPNTARVKATLTPAAVRTVAEAVRQRTAQATEPESPDLISELERLDALYRSGSLTDAEYTRAKRRLLA